MMNDMVHVVGGGLAGSEAAWQIAEIGGVSVVLHEMRPERQTDVHKTSDLAELVCSNSLRSDDWAHNAVGLLHAEMRRCDSLIMAAADANQVPAGGALAVDRDGFAAWVTRRLQTHPRIALVREEVAWPPEAWDNVVVATGPLTSPALSQALLQRTGEDALAFFDAIAPIVHLDSVDMSKVWRQSRYDKEGPGGDAAAYINCPMDKAQYEAFVRALVEGPKTDFKDWERTTPYFDGCLPIEVMAERGPETLRFGPMKPVGLTNPHKPHERPYAVVQLRQDNALGTLYNLVGFQTKLKHGAQAAVFRTIPGLEAANFARLGGLHRNTFLNAPKLLDQRLRLKADPRLRFAGQITGVEGYVESAATGILAGRFAAADRLGRSLEAPSGETAMGALLGHITGGHLSGANASFQPMNINYGLLPPLSPEGPKRSDDGRKLSPTERGRAKKQRLSERALASLDDWLTPQRAAA